MHGYGGGRVIRSLLSYPCKLSVKATLATLQERIKQQDEAEIFRIYIAESIRLQSEGKYISAKYEEIINPKPEDTRTATEMVEDVVQKVGIEVVK